MKIAYTMSPGRGDTDLLLASLAESLVAKGVRPVGTVQINTECAEPGRCDMDVKLLPDGQTIRISQTLGAGAKGCRLDPGALEIAVGLTDRALDGAADLLIINKFGKHEASGAGFRPVIAKALDRDIPVIVGLGRQNIDAFQEFSGGIADEVPPSLDALAQWFDTATTTAAAPATVS